MPAAFIFWASALNSAQSVGSGGAYLVNRRLGHEQRVDAVGLQRQRDRVAVRLVQLGKLGGDELSVAGLGDDTVEIDGRRDLDQAAISGPFNCDAGRGSPPINLGTRLVHHLGREPAPASAATCRRSA
ncbi:MAG TPA: hypothetical protein VHS58_01990 [Acetobacteraceae bacterium]|nr:hypothetical protein [Acetobacteraceae bacterium]